MGELVKALLEGSGQYGAGYIVGALTLALYWVAHKDLVKERAAHARTADKLLELSTASIKADVEHTSAIVTLGKVLDSIDRRLS